MQANDHPEQYLKKAYLGEIRGEATFRAFVDVFPEHRAALELLAEVERATAQFLKPKVTADVSQAELDRAREQANARIENFKVKSWQQFVESILPTVEQALATMKEAHAFAPSELLTVYETYTAHEQALLDYLSKERRGEKGEHELTGYLNGL